MLTVPVLGDEWSKEGISVNAVYPGVCSTNIKRHMGVDKSITGKYYGDISSKSGLWPISNNERFGTKFSRIINTTRDELLSSKSGEDFKDAHREESLSCQKFQKKF